MNGLKSVSPNILHGMMTSELPENS